MTIYESGECEIVNATDLGNWLNRRINDGWELVKIWKRPSSRRYFPKFIALFRREEE